MRRVGAIAALVLLTGTTMLGCSPSSTTTADASRAPAATSGTEPDSTEPPDLNEDTLGPGATVRPRTTTSANGVCNASGTTIPDGHWNGPLVFDAEGTANSAAGSVTSTGQGELDLTISQGAVTGNKWGLEASSTGSMSVGATTADINGHMVVKDGTVSGTADAVSLTGPAQLTGQIILHVSGQNVSRPLDGDYTATADLTIVRIQCDEVVATMIPSLEQQTGGRAQYSGQATWTAHRV